MAITKSSGNVFEDLGFDPAESVVLELRSSLMLAIKREIRRRHINQTQAAKLFGVTQPRISDLKRGKIDLFTVESLIGMLSRAGVAVSVTIGAHIASAVSEGIYASDLQIDQTSAISSHAPIPTSAIASSYNRFRNLELSNQHNQYRQESSRSVVGRHSTYIQG